MPQVAKGKRKVNFRKALMAADQVDYIKAGEFIAQLEKREWFDEQRHTFVKFFRHWWSENLSKIRGEAGRKGGASQKQKLLTQRCDMPAQDFNSLTPCFCFQ